MPRIDRDIVFPLQSSAATPAARVVRHAVALIENFLPEAAWRTLLERVLASEAQFAPSATHDRRNDYRQSLVLNPPADLVQPVVARVRQAIPQALGVLRLPPVQVGIVEAQVTASVDGSFFGVHNDAGNDQVRKRRLTYVYYFHRAPKGFTGGELRVYDDIVRNGKLARGETHHTIEPLHNRIVLFWAGAMHEVMRVDMPSRAFADARFTVNGWINAG